jgi:hypothetical protein
MRSAAHELRPRHKSGKEAFPMNKVIPLLWRRPFKRCPMCRVVWDTSADFLKDAGLRHIGHQGGARPGDPGLTMFNHSCGTTLAIEAARSKVRHQTTGNKHGKRMEELLTCCTMH